MSTLERGYTLHPAVSKAQGPENTVQLSGKWLTIRFSEWCWAMGYSVLRCSSSSRNLRARTPQPESFCTLAPAWDPLQNPKPIKNSQLRTAHTTRSKAETLSVPLGEDGEGGQNKP